MPDSLAVPRGNETSDKVHPPANAPEPRRGPPRRGDLRAALQRRPPAQRHRLRHPADKLAGREQGIFAERDRSLAEGGGPRYPESSA
jgi:hypothetical protein